MAGAPQGLSEKGRITASQSSGSKMAEARPNLHWGTCVRPAFLLASFLDVNHHATLPCEGFYRSPCRMDTSPLAAPNVPLCHPWYRLASCISRFRGMVSTLLSEWRKARVVSDAPSPALAIQMYVHSSSAGLSARHFLLLAFSSRSWCRQAETLTCQ